MQDDSAARDDLAFRGYDLYRRRIASGKLVQKPRCSARGCPIFRPEARGDLFVMPGGGHAGERIDLLVKADPCPGLEAPSDCP